MYSTSSPVGLLIIKPTRPGYFEDIGFIALGVFKKLRAITGFGSFTRVGVIHISKI